MGKKNKNKNKKTYNNLPNVSICTPTFNRRPFFEGLIQSIKEQDYPHDKIEWIIIDDGTDKIENIIQDPETIKILHDIKISYYHYEDKLDLGKKRNLMHQKCNFTNDEDIIVYMDDDDYYPPERVSHSVKKLTQDDKVLCGGSSELYLWFNTLDKMYKFGPYGPNHATAGTFAFKRKLLKQTSYEDGAVLAEEKHFLKNYTIPFVQFDPFKTILVVSHEQNTFDKRKLLSSQNNFVKESTVSVKQFIKNKELKTFYESKINKLLDTYEAGNVKNKPKVLKEIAKREKDRAEQMKILQVQQDNKPSGIFVSDGTSSEQRQLTIRQCKEYMTTKTNECLMLQKELMKIKEENIILKDKLNKK